MSNPDVSNRKPDIVDALIANADGVEETGPQQWKCCCPAHDDENPSLSFGRSENGTPLVTCHAGCTFEQIEDAIKPKIEGSLRVMGKARRTRGEFKARYFYEDEEGRVLYAVARFHRKDGGKTFALQVQDEKGDWWDSRKGTDREYRGRRVLYRLPRVVTATCVLVVEGEKCVHAAEGLGLTATCNPFGAGKWRDEYSEHLRGKRVVVLPDNDKAGREHATTIARSLDGVASDVRILDLGRVVSGFPDRGDLPDWVQHFDGDREKLLSLVETRAEAPPPLLKMRKLSEVPIERTFWLWEPFFPEGDATIIGGKQGVAKSLVICDLAARISRGAPWPDGKGTFERGTVIILAAEDALERKLKPRLMVANADPDKVLVLEGTPTEEGKPKHFNIDEDLWRLDQVIPKIGDVRAVFIDPVDAYIGTHNPNDNQEVRNIMQALADLAERHGIAVIGNRHFRKSLTDCAIDKLIGASAWSQVARVVHFVDYEDRRKTGSGRCFVPVKNNYAALPKGLLFDIQSVDTRHLYDESHPRGRRDCEAQVLWREARMDVTAEEMYDFDPLQRVTQGVLARAKGLLLSKLGEGPQPMKELVELADSEGISETTLRRAKDQLHIMSQRQGNRYVWMMPEQFAAEVEKLEREVPPDVLKGVKEGKGEEF